VQPIEQLPYDLENFLFFEDVEALLEVEEGVLGVLHDEVDVRLAGVEIVEFYEIFMFNEREDLDFPDEVFSDLSSVCNRH
jgi:hypothetical protein